MIDNFSNLGTALSREDLRKLTGALAPGDSCSFTWQDSGGAWHTETGTCKIAVSGSAGGSSTYTPYCNTASHTEPTPLSSNGGTSRCGEPVTWS